MRILRYGLIMMSVGLLSSCYSLKGLEQPDIKMQANYQPSVETQALSIDENWWQGFSSEQLNQLIQQALANSPDLKIASQRVIQSQLQLSSANGELFPSLSVSASTGDTRSQPSGSSTWQSSKSSRVSLNASYEIDFWGRVAASRANAKATFKAQQYDYQTARLTLISSLAQSWFNWLAMGEKIALNKQLLSLAEQSYQLNQALYDNGAISASDLASAQNTLISQQATLEPLVFQRQQLQNSIAILLGVAPAEFSLSEENLFALTVPDIQVGVPADLLTRRPDLASSEASLAAAHANVAVARANMLPSVQISASIGRAAAKLFSLGDGTDSMGLSGSLTQAIFAHGQLKNQYKISQSQQTVLLEQYRQTILTALKEAYEAIETVQINQQQEQQSQQIEQAVAANVQREKIRYEQGKDDLTAVVNMQKSYVQAQQQLVEWRQARLNAAVALYQALGGGWQKPE